MPTIKDYDSETKKVVKEWCDHTVGKWGDELMSILDLETTKAERYDFEREITVMYADQSAWLDKKLFWHVRFKYCPDCGKKLNFKAIRKHLERISCIE